MQGSKLIPETGQEVEVVRLHPIDWTGAVAYIRELRNCLALRTLIINDNFSIAENVLVDAMIQYVRNYMLTTHFNHYQRLLVATGVWTPSKAKAFYNEEVPEVFVSIARHLSRPRILIDGSVSIPVPTAPVCNGIRYGGLVAVDDNTMLRNQVTAGPALAVLQAINILGTPVSYRQRMYMAIRRNFSGLKMTELIKKEGLHPARLCYWRSGLDRFVSLLDRSSAFEEGIFELDCLLSPITFPDLPDPGAAPVVPPDPAVDADVLVYGRAMIQYNQRSFPAAIQWLGTDPLSGNNRRFTRDTFLERECSSQIAHPELTVTFARNRNLANIGDDLTKYHFPDLGAVDAIESLRILVNDMGSGIPGNQRNQRRTAARQTNSNSRVDRASKRALKRDVSVGETDQKDNGAATDEKVESTENVADSDSLQREKQATSNNAGRRRRKKKDKT